MRRLSTFSLVLYDDPYTPNFSLDDMMVYLTSFVPSERIQKRGEVIREWLARLPPELRDDHLHQVARRFAQARVLDPYKPVTARDPTYGETAYEERRLTVRGEAKGVIYDGWEFQSVLKEILGREVGSPARPTVIFTNQLLATFDEGDRRYHLRTIILGFPSLVSLPGLVEAPAKPREYYLLRDQLLASGIPAPGDLLEVSFRDRCLTPADPRLTEVAKGYALQGIFYQVFGEAFCPDPECRLYNAHWQEEMLRAQLDGRYDLCLHHRAMALVLAELAKDGAGGRHEEPEREN